MPDDPVPSMQGCTPRSESETAPTSEFAACPFFAAGWPILTRQSCKDSNSPVLVVMAAQGVPGPPVAAAV